MKSLLLIGLLALTSASVFANSNCDVSSIDCHVGTYRGTSTKEGYNNQVKEICEIVIKRTGKNKNDIYYSNTLKQSYGGPFSDSGFEKQLTVPGQVSSETQNYEYLDTSVKKLVSKLQLQTKISKTSNKNLNTLELLFDDQENIKAIDITTRVYQSQKNSAVPFQYDYQTCHNIVKIN